MSSQTAKLELARARTSFDTSGLTILIFDSQENATAHKNAFQRVEKILGSADMSKLPEIYLHNSQEGQLLQGLKAGKVAFEDGIKYNHDIFHFITPMWRLGNENAIGVHTALFLHVLKREVSDEQAKNWVPFAESGNILGAYVQTELGHGTFVGGIETTASFDRETDEFVVESPTLSSTKYWPGALSYSCTHAILMARLIIDAQDHGVHPFMVQLRSMEDHKPVSGVELGDIGTKLAYNRNDNGYAVFKNLRIPRINLLMKHAQVERDGTYHESPLRQKLTFGGMLTTRVVMIRLAAFQFAQALTICTRYSIVREQGYGTFGSRAGAEKSIIEFKSQHFRLLVLISRAYAILFASKDCNPHYKDMLKRQIRGDHTTLPFVHTLVCGLKAWSSEIASSGAEEARKMAGGHGYMNISGLPDIVSSVTAFATFEGENWVLWQQLASYLVKNGRNDSSSLPADMAYLECYPDAVFQQCTARGKEFRNLDSILPIFKHRAARLVLEAINLISASELNNGAAWNKFMMPLIGAARAHTELQVLTSFIDRIQPVSEPAVRAILTRLCALFALSTITSPTSVNTISFVEDGHLSFIQLTEIREQIDILLEELLPDAVGLTDAWNFTDASLASAIGCYDGDAYARIMSWTRQLPINIKAKKQGGVFVEGFEKTLKSLFTSKL